MSFVALTCLLIAIDGDTLRCGKERIRLLGIDAPEMPGHCRRGRKCVPGDPYASKASLASMLTGKATIRRSGQDRYGRTLAKVRVNGIDLATAQLHGGMASLYSSSFLKKRRVFYPEVVRDIVVDDES